MRIEYFIARRMNLSCVGEGSNVITRIATTIVAVGVAVMIISMAVIKGFRTEIVELLGGFGSHIQVVHMGSHNSLETVPISIQQPFQKDMKGNSEIVSIQPYAIKAGITRSDNDIQGVMLKGVGSSYDWRFFEERLCEGTLPRTSDSIRTKDVLISKRLSDILQISLGDPLDMLFLQNPPRRDRFRVCGIYHTGINQMDNLMVLTDIRNIQRLNRWDSTQVSGFEIMLSDIENLQEHTLQLERSIYTHNMDYADRLLDKTDSLATIPFNHQSLMVSNLRERYPAIFDWLNTHNVNALIIIIIMTCVCLLGMISAMLIIILERVRMIGTLKSLGMNNKSLQRLFLFRTSGIVFKGMVWGNAIGIILCMIQKYTGIITLNSNGYFLTVVPIELGLGWILLLNICTFVMIVAALTLPTLIISMILPEKSIRFE